MSPSQRCSTPHHRPVMRVFTLIEARANCVEASVNILGAARPTRCLRHTWMSLITRSLWHLSFWSTLRRRKFGARTCNASTNDFVPLRKLATTLLFSKAQTDCCTVVVRHDCQLHLNRSTASFVRSRTFAVGKRRSCFF